MPKGKKYDAAERHFIEKQTMYEKRIKGLQETLSNKNAELIKVRQERDELHSENARLQDWVERLLQYTELSREDIKTVCEQDKQKGIGISRISGLLNFASRFTF